MQNYSYTLEFSKRLQTPKLILKNHIVGKPNDDDLTLEEYLDLIRAVGQEVYRVLRPGAGMRLISLTWGESLLFR